MDSEDIQTINNASQDEIASYIMGLIQYIQMTGPKLLDDPLIKRFYRLRKFIKTDNIITFGSNNIIKFFEKLEEHNTQKIYDSCYVIRRIDLIYKLFSKKFVIFPCNINKTPRTRGWNKLTFNESVKLFMSQEIDFTNIGLVCGEQSGVVVIDVDNKNDGIAYWNDLIEKNGPIDTLTTITGSNGRHYYFNYDESMKNWISVNRIFMVGDKKIGIDFRARNGFVIVPPSIHEACQREYTFIDFNKPIANMPNWLKTMLNSYFEIRFAAKK